MRQVSSFIPALLALNMACQAKLNDIPTNAMLACGTTTECPPGYFCNGSGRCVTADKIHSSQPALDPPPTVLPARGKAGTTFHIAITSTKGLITPPDVELELDNSLVPAKCAGSSPTQFDCTYSATGMENGRLGGTIAFNVTLADFDGNIVPLQHVGYLVMDFVAPTLASHSVSPANCGSGATIHVFFTPSKAIDADGGVSVTSSVPLGGQTQLAAVNDPHTSNYHVDYTLAPMPRGLPDGGTVADPVTGDVSFTVALTDLAGNPSGDLDVGTTHVDQLIPTILNPHTDSLRYSDQPVHDGLPAHNLVTLTFGVAKPVQIPSQLAATIGGQPFACVAVEGQTASYSCTYTVKGTEPAGAQSIVITTQDESGNTHSATATVTFDFTALSLTGTVTPSPANASDSPVLSVSANKAIAEPTLTVTQNGTATSLLGAPKESGGPGTAWTWSFAQVPLMLVGNFDLNVAGVDDVGHAFSKDVTFSVDANVPVIKNVETLNAQTPPAPATRFSAISPFDVVNLTFLSTKSLGVPSATLGGLCPAPISSPTMAPVPCAFTCGPYDSASQQYQCTYHVTGQEMTRDGTAIDTVPEVSLPVSITGMDSAGNAVSAGTSVTLDFMPPAILGTASATPSAAGVGQTESVVVAASEPLSGSPSIQAAGPGTLTFNFASGTSYEFQHLIQATDTSGNYTTQIMMEDLVGNKPMMPLAGPSFEVDTKLPVISAVTVNANRFSTLPGYSSIKLTFDVTKSLDNSSTPLSVTLGGLCPPPAGSTPSTPTACVLQCSAFQLTFPSYTCTYQVSGNELTADGSAIKSISQAVLPVFVQGLDAAGNPASASTTVTLDFTPPSLISQQATVPNAGVGQVESLVLSASEPLQVAPGVITGGTGKLPFALAAGTTYTFQHTITSSDPSGLYTSAVSMIDLAGNPASATGPSFNVDTNVPVVSKIVINAARFSAVAGFNQIQATFQVNKSLDTAGSSLLVALDAECPLAPKEQCLFKCGTYQAMTKQYACTYLATATELTNQGVSIAQLAQANVPVLITAVDEAGNSAAATATVTLDFQAPILLSASATVPIVGVGRQEQLIVAANETLTGPPTLVVMGPGSAPAFQWEAQTAYAFAYGVQASDPSGTYTSLITLTDAVGNAANAVTGPSFTVDSVIPRISNVKTSASIYSEASGFNAVTLTFDTAKPVDMGRTVTLSGRPMSCNGYQAQSPRYTCTYTASLAQDTSGPQSIVIQTVDEAGNSDTANVTIDFDFSLLTISGTIAPSPVKSGVTPAFTVAASKPLSVAPKLAVTSNGMVSNALGTTTTTGSGTSWTFTYPATAAPLAGTFSIVATATDIVGHVASSLPVAFTVDAVVPTISNVATSASTYSEVLGFNVVSLTFNTPKSVDASAGATLTATIAGASMTCGAYQATPPNYTCTYTVTAAKDTSGAKTINIAATDAVGNNSSATTSVTFDLNALTMTGTIAPNPAKAGVTPVFSVSASKPLTAAPKLSVTQGGNVTTALGSTTNSGSGTSWTFTFPATAPPLSGTFTISATALDSVGHSGTTPVAALTILVVDAVIPMVSNVATNAAIYSEVAGFNTVNLTFNTAKSVDASAGGTLTATIAGNSFVCGAYKATAPNYACTYTVTTAKDTTGAKGIAISATDEVGNVNTATASVSFDLTAVTLTGRMAPNPAKAGVTPVFSVSASKPLPAAPTIAVTLGGVATSVLGTPVTGGSGTSWTFSYPVTASPLVGTFNVTAQGTDAVGHMGTSASNAFVVDAVVPTISSVSTGASTYSEIAGFNTVSLKFNTPKSVDASAGGTLSATLGGANMACGSYQAAPPNYTCTYAVSATADTSGAKTIAITAIDEAGNASSASTSVTFDLTGLVLNSHLAPSPAKVSDIPVMAISASKPLPVAPVLTSVTTTGTGSLGSPVITGAGTAWSLTFPAASPPLQGIFNVSVTGQDNVGHTQLTTASFTVDAIVPVISNVATNAQRYSAVSGHKLVSVTFNSSKVLDVAPSSLAVTMGIYPMTCGTYSAGGTANYTCTYTFTGTETVNGALISSMSEAVLPVSIRAIDEVGNQGSGGTVVTVDFMPPSLTGATLNYIFLPTSKNVLKSVAGAQATAATVGTDIHLAFAVSEALNAVPGNPTVSSAPSGLVFAQTSGGGTSFVFDAPMNVAGSPADGTYALNVSATDLVGNTATLTTAVQAVVDTVAPGSPNVASLGPVTYTRIPWGDNATGAIPTFQVTGAAGAITDPATGYVAVFDSSGDQLGAGAVLGGGSFGPITLSQADRQSVSIAGVDEAGNVSSPVAVNNFVWKATLDVKSPGNFFTNPNYFQTANDFLVTGASSPFVGPLFQLPTESAEATSTGYAALALPSDSLTLTTPMDTFVWLNRVPTNPQTIAGRDCSGMVYDSARGQVVLFGGQNVNGTFVNDTWEWDGTTWTNVTPLSTSPDGRCNFAMSYDAGRGRTVIYGGLSSGSFFPNDTWEWDGAQWNNVSPAGPNPGPRFEYSMSYDPVHQVSVLFGGVSINGMTANSLNDTWTWNGVTWTNVIANGVAGSPPARDNQMMIYDGASKATIMVGGCGGAAFTCSPLYADAWSWNGTVWTQLAPGGTTFAGRYGGGIDYDASRQRVVVFGGGNLSTEINDTWELSWNGTTYSWSNPLVNGNATGPSARQFPGMAYDPIHAQTILMGGMPTNITQLADTWTWNGSTWANVTPAVVTFPSARSNFAMSYDSGRGRAVVFGGNSAQGGSLNDTWEWNGFAWTQGPAAPAALGTRTDLAMAYDAATGVANTVLFGGNQTGNLQSDTWTWTGTVWTQKTPATIPPIRSQHSMAYFSTGAGTGYVLMFGGCSNLYSFINCTGTLNDTWQWNGTNWTKLTPAASPPGRAYGNMAFDSARGRIVLFGGCGTYDSSTPPNGGCKSWLNDTWEWNGSNWLNVTPGSIKPTARQQFAMAYDPARGRTVIFGGQGGNGLWTDLAWEWDGTSWTNVTSTVTVPVPRYGQSMIEDTARSRLVSFGGSTAFSAGTNDLLESPSDPARRAAAIAELSFAATGETPQTNPIIQSVTFDAFASGAGNTLVVPGDGIATPGVTMAAWNGLVGGWSSLLANTSASPTELKYTTSSAAEASSYLFGYPQTIYLALFPTAGRGNGPGATQVTVDYAEVTVQYHH